MRRSSLPLLTLALVSALWARDARATVPCARECDCPTVLTATTPVILFPIDYGLDLPTNGRILVSPPFDSAAFTWVDAADTAIPFDVVPLDGSDAVWLVPRAALTPSTSYVVSNPFFAYARPFRSGPGADVAPPTLTAASLPPRTTLTTLPCDPLVAGRTAIDVSETASSAALLGTYVLLDVRITTTDGRPEVRYWSGSRVGSTELALGAAVGGGVCAHDYPGSTSTFPGAAVGDVVTVTVSAIDAAGNASTPLVLAPLTLSAVAAGPSERAGACCGCRVGAPGGPPASWAFALVLALLMGRRASRR